MVRIRRAKSPKDWSVIVDLGYLCFPDSESISLDDHWWIATDNKNPVGFAGTRVIDTYETYSFGVLTGPAIFLCRCGVRPEYRGNGLQRRFIRVRERWARAHHYSQMITYTSADNFYSQRNLIRCGYDEYPTDGSFIIWKKRLI